MANIKRKFRNLDSRINLRFHDLLFPDYAHIRHIPQHLDIISLGSRPAKFAIDFNDTGVRGFNLAVVPQTLEYDFRMLKNYFSYFDDNGPRAVLLVLCPFTLLKTRYSLTEGHTALDHRYYLVLHPALINNYSHSTHSLIKYHPALYSLSITPRLKGLLGKRLQRQLAMASNPLDENGMKESAMNYISSWMKEFSITSLDDNLPGSASEAIGSNKSILADIVTFCRERQLKPIAVIPPLSKNLLELIPDKFMNRALLSPLKECGITTIDFSHDEKLCDATNFRDALCLNSSGRKLFTTGLINHLKTKELI
ncbi:MAG: hypothetical protein K2G24_07110 [Muribaculaceae bacterium]|nr:hypothetical protein [Muribaculaceae bacterium]